MSKLKSCKCLIHKTYPETSVQASNAVDRHELTDDNALLLERRSDGIDFFCHDLQLSLHHSNGVHQLSMVMSTLFTPAH